MSLAQEQIATSRQCRQQKCTQTHVYMYTQTCTHTHTHKYPHSIIPIWIELIPKWYSSKQSLDPLHTHTHTLKHTRTHTKYPHSNTHLNTTYQSIELARKKKEEDKLGSRGRHLASDSGPRGTSGRKPEATQSNRMRTAHRLGMRPIYNFFFFFFFFLQICFPAEDRIFSSEISS